MQEPHEDSQFVAHEPCPSCGSRDNLARYDDGHAYCFGCQYYEKGTEMRHENAQVEITEPDGKESVIVPLPQEGSSKQKGLLPQGETKALRKRGINEDTCSKWNYTVGAMNGQTCQIANYYNNKRQVVAQKVRFPDKRFIFLGDTKAVGLYGDWLWRDGGKMIVVAEGELDALTISQLQGNKWPVVSVPNGAAGALKSVKKNMEWLCKFDTVVFMFDNDDPGNAAAAECAQALPPGKAKVAHLPLKDASDMLTSGRGSEVIDAIWGAKEYRPDGIVAATDLWDEFISDDDADSVPYPWDGLNELTRGLRKGELVTFTAGSGIGKSSVCREIAHHLLTMGEKVGYIALEESVKRTLRGIVGIQLNKPLHLERGEIEDGTLREAFDKVCGDSKLYLYDHFGSIDGTNLLDRIRYLSRGLDVNWIILDHLSIVVSGDDSISDERRAIDVTMTKLRSLVEETGIGLILVSHLKRPEGKGHEEGARTTLAQLRGSAAIAQLSDMVLGLERNQQDPQDKNKTIIRVLKNRFSGETGEASVLHYDNGSGRISEQPFTVVDDADPTGF